MLKLDKLLLQPHTHTSEKMLLVATLTFLKLAHNSIKSQD